jgi:predicted nucleotidyltransferase
MNANAILPRSLVSLRVYGSFSRGDFDEWSDVDVLAVYGERPAKEEQEALRRHLARLYSRKVDVAEYSRPRIEKFFSHGHLFAWHLYSESKSLAAGRDDFFESLGPPAPYADAHSDAEGFLRLLRTSRREIMLAGSSLVYEAGMMYLASRNVAICSSYMMNNRPDFSRLALYNLCNQLQVRPTVSVAAYRTLMLCRFASIRGQEASAPAVGWTSAICKELESLCENVIHLCSKTYGTIR